MKGNIYVQKGDLEKAAEMYQKALKANPDQFEAKENLKRIRHLNTRSGSPRPAHAAADRRCRDSRANLRV